MESNDEENHKIESMEISQPEESPVKKTIDKKTLIIILSISIIAVIIIIAIIIAVALKDNKGNDENNRTDGDSKNDDGDDEIDENIGYSFNATYANSEDNELVKLINPIYEDYIINMTIDSESFKAKTEHTFELQGNHSVYVLMDISKIDSIEQIFYQLDKMISISFTTKFNTKNIVNMNEMFYYCTSLTSIEIS